MQFEAPGPGTILQGLRGRYQLLAEVGRGAFGVTHRARRIDPTGMGVDVAPAPGQDEVIVKTLMLPGQTGWKAVELFEREAQVLRALSHPLIPAWVDDVRLGDPAAPQGFALVMQLQPGPSLRQVMRGPGLSRGQLLGLLADVLEVLAFIHGRAPPLIHRDVNPKNIIVRPDGRAALVDFGSVQAALRAAASGGMTAAGTFGYAPMEQFLGQATPRSDLYGLGMTALAACSGREPEELPLAGIAIDVPAVVSEPRLARWLAALVAPDPRDRLGSAEEALALLRRLPGGTTEARAKPPRTIAATPGDRTLERLARQLGGGSFTVERGGQLGQTSLAWRAVREASGLTGSVLQVIAAPAGALAEPGQPLAPIPAALFVQGVADAFAPSGGWRALLAGKPLLVPLLYCPDGVAPRTGAHIQHSLREPQGALVIPALLLAGVDGQPERLELLPPRSLLAGDPRDCLAQVRAVLSLQR